MNNNVNRLIFFVGWMLSPLTFWNDAFVNIPISYLCAFILAKIVRIDFLSITLATYWITNLLGIALMYAAGKGIFRKGRVLKDVLSLVITMAVYSVAIILISNLLLGIKR